MADRSCPGRISFDRPLGHEPFGREPLGRELEAEWLSVEQIEAEWLGAAFPPLISLEKNVGL